MAEIENKINTSGKAMSNYINYGLLPWRVNGQDDSIRKERLAERFDTLYNDFLTLNQTSKKYCSRLDFRRLCFKVNHKNGLV